MPSSCCADRRDGRRRRDRACLTLLLVAVCALSLAGCGDASSRTTGGVGDAARGDATGGAARVELRPVSGSGTGGAVTLAPAGGGTEIRLSLEGLPDPGAVYVGAIYRGACGDEAGRQGERPAGPARRGETVYRFVHGGGDEPVDDDVVQTLTSVESGSDGTGASVTPLPATPDELLAGGPKYVDVHGESGSALACADLAPAGASNA